MKKIKDRLNNNQKKAWKLQHDVNISVAEILQLQQEEIEILKKENKILNKKINKLPEFAEWYIKNCAGGYQE
jgi:cob(I)alamin adenosyltransferase